MSRRDMLASMSGRELQEWIAYDKIEPIPAPWAQTGLLAALLHNGLSTGPRKKPEDFIPAVIVRREQTAEEGMANMAMIAAAYRQPNLD